jgi:acetyl esterase/lipase
MSRFFYTALLSTCLLSISVAGFLSVTVQPLKSANSIDFSSYRTMASDSSVAADSTTTTPTDSSNRMKPMMGRWEELHGNYILRPNVEESPPRALLHFLGGALVGAVPHVAYRYMLESLADKGYLVVATPYNLSFDHLDTCDVVIQRFEKIAPSLARQYGAVPVVGVGHSCGALLQLLITSLFPDTPRAANALMSFNNKPVKDAVPFFDEFFAPFFTSVASDKNGTTPSSIDVIKLSLELARTASQGDVPSDDLVTEIKRVLTPSLLAGLAPDSVILPAALRTGLQTLIAPSATALSGAGILPLMNQVVDTLDQIPLLIEEVAGGARDFVPPPSSVRAVARRSYRARRTLILQYDNDGIDESEEIEELLKEAESRTRMKRPMIEIDVQRRTLSGGHATPLIAPPLDLANRAEDILGKDAAKKRLLYAEADATVAALVEWLEEANL